MSAQFQTPSLKALSAEPAIARSATAQFDDRVVNQLSYSHFELLVRLDLPEKRSFYQAQCIAGSWSVRQLKRQINSLLYERYLLELPSKEVLAAELEREHQRIERQT